MDVLSHFATTELLKRALAEDVGQGDITTVATVDEGKRGRARITVKEPHMILAGGPLVAHVFNLAGAAPRIAFLAAEGAELKVGDRLAEYEGELRGLLTGERVALNFVQLLSGIATLAHAFAAKVAGTRARIVDTRKTHPGLRALEKYAVRTGGAFNPRFGLDSGVLIKENHIAAAGGIRAAVERARANAPHSFRVEIECETLKQVEDALAARADAILLDNMSLDDIRRARKLAGDAVLLEVSGGVTVDNVRAIAETGVDLISVGALTHSATVLDLGLDIEIEPEERRA